MLFCPVGCTARMPIQTLPGASPNSAAVTGERLFSKCGRDKKHLARPEPCVALAARERVKRNSQLGTPSIFQSKNDTEIDFRFQRKMILKRQRRMNG